MGFLAQSFRIGKLFGITIRVHIIFLIWIGYSLLSAGAGWKDELEFLALIFGIVLLHEFGHCFGARAVGGDAHNILMWPLGGLAYAEAPMRPWPQFVTVAAGPAVNLLFCIASAATIFAISGGALLPNVNPLNPSFHLLGPAQTVPPPWIWHVFIFYHVNLMLLCFNLLPVFPLDGGQLFRSIIWPFVGLNRATVVSAQAGIVGAVCLAAVGIRYEQYMLLAIAIFGGMTSWQHYQAARHGLFNDDLLGSNHVVHNRGRSGSFFGRIFGRRPKPTSDYGAPRRPEPPTRPRTISDDEELDRLLAKVSKQGIESLSYVERQTLERITHQRKREDREFQRQER